MTEMKRSQGKRGAGSGTLSQAPTIATVRPSQSPTEGGKRVTITGAHFAQGCMVTFGGARANNVEVSADKIECINPPHAAGMVDVVVKNPDGKKCMPAGKFEYA